MTNKEIASIILEKMDFDSIVYTLQSDKNGAKILDKCNWNFDELIYWAQCEK